MKINSNEKTILWRDIPPQWNPILQPFSFHPLCFILFDIIFLRFLHWENGFVRDSLTKPDVISTKVEFQIEGKWTDFTHPFLSWNWFKLWFYDEITI
jgi:hypothetical protein